MTPENPLIKTLTLIGFIILILISIVITVVFFEKGIPTTRNELLQPLTGFMLSILLIYIVYSYSGYKDKILGWEFDKGQILYVLIILFLFFVMV